MPAMATLNPYIVPVMLVVATAFISSGETAQTGPMELEIPVIALTQLNRNVVDAHGNVREPQLSDLRDSGSLEQDAGVVLMLHTDDIDQRFEKRRFIDLFIRKNRYGRLGKISYTYYGDYSEFVEKKWEDGKPVSSNYNVLGEI